MELGLGLYARMLTRDNLAFARQAGATAIVVHMADYTTDGPRHSHFDADAKGWDVSGARGKLWTVEELVALRELVESEGLRLAALENLNPALWYDVLLDGAEKQSQLEGIRTIIRRMGQAGILCLGYNFTLAGVWGPRRLPSGRGGAGASSFDAADPVVQKPIRNGEVWNRVYDPTAPEGVLAPVPREALLRRHRDFLAAVLPVAEESGVVLAAHPDDPPLETVRGQARFMHRPLHFREMVDSYPSPSNRIELCIGTVAEMPGADVYTLAEDLARGGHIGYVHFRNVRGQVPTYTESFVDDGDVDMPRVLAALCRGGFSGVLIPDHTPLMTCGAPWHAGMAFALGYMRAALRAAETDSNREFQLEASPCR